MHHMAHSHVHARHLTCAWTTQRCCNSAHSDVVLCGRARRAASHVVRVHSHSSIPARERVGDSATTWEPEGVCLVKEGETAAPTKRRWVA